METVTLPKGYLYKFDDVFVTKIKSMKKTPFQTSLFPGL